MQLCVIYLIPVNQISDLLLKAWTKLRTIYYGGSEGVKWEWDLGKFSPGKSYLGHWDWESQTIELEFGKLRKQFPENWDLITPPPLLFRIFN